MTRIINIRSLDFDVSNKCGNTCQGCYHNKVITENTTSPENFQKYLGRFFEINRRKKLESFALYGGNILENRNLGEYLNTVNHYDKKIEQYLFSTTFGEYNALAKANQSLLLGNFFKNKRFIFQYFFNPDFIDAYIASCKDLLKYKYQTHVFFSVQLVEVEKKYVLKLIKTLQRFFVSIGCRNRQDLERIEESIMTAIKHRDRTENIEIKIQGYTFLLMTLHPVRKEYGKITSVCGDSCSFFSSSNVTNNSTYESSMLSIEYDGVLNFHNPNCIASLQKICNISEDYFEIETKLKGFYKFLDTNIQAHADLLSACNGCLKHNIKK